MKMKLVERFENQNFIFTHQFQFFMSLFARVGFHVLVIGVFHFQKFCSIYVWLKSGLIVTVLANVMQVMRACRLLHRGSS